MYYTYILNNNETISLTSFLNTRIAIVACMTCIQQKYIKSTYLVLQFMNIQISIHQAWLKLSQLKTSAGPQRNPILAPRCPAARQQSCVYRKNLSMHHRVQSLVCHELIIHLEVALPSCILQYFCFSRHQSKHQQVPNSISGQLDRPIRVLNTRSSPAFYR